MDLQVKFLKGGSIKIDGYKSLWNNRELWCSTFDINILKRINPNPNTIIEFGSYDGGDGIKYKYYFPKANIYSIEPSPNCYNKLKNLEKYGLKTFNYAISNKNSIVDFYETYDVTNKNYAPCGSINKDLISNEKAYNRDALEIKNSVKIESKRLDSFCFENNIEHVDLVHIDVEGHAREVLEGFGNLRPKIVFIEVSSSKYNHSKDINASLKNMGYNLVSNIGCDRVYIYG